MIIPENREKVKRKAQSLINRNRGSISKPEKKFLLEVVMGIITSGSCNLSEIGRSLKEATSLKHTLKRLQRMLTHDHLLDKCNDLCLSESSSLISDETILALDGGDITHQYGEKFEHIQPVRDGSTKEIEGGFHLNQVSGYNPSCGRTFPVLLDLYSTSESGFKSANNESLQMVSKVVDAIGLDGLWVMDRDYDSGIILEFFLRRGLSFAVRAEFKRNLIVKGKPVNIKEAAAEITRRYEFDSHRRFGSRKVFIKLNRREYEVTLISFKDPRNDEPLLLLCNGWIKSTKELKRRIRGYFHRWGVEESYRFEKQGFGIEKCTFRKFSRIKTMIGLTLLSWLLLVKIDESPKLKEVVLKSACMEKDKKNQRPKFIYYRLLKGVQNLFSGITELFRYRWKKERKKQYRETLAGQKTLFPDIIGDLHWLDFECAGKSRRCRVA